MPADAPESGNSGRPAPPTASTYLPAHLPLTDAVVHQATGFVCAGLAISPDDALVILKREAQLLDIGLVELAGEIIERRRPLPRRE